MMTHDSDDEVPENTEVPAVQSSEPIIREVLDVEKERVNRDNRRTALMERTLDFADTKDKRQYEFASKTRDAEMALRKDRLRLLRTIVWVVLGLGSVILLSLLGLVFFGNEDQRATAAALASPALIGLAGYGVITTLTRALKALTGRQ